jgi:site-specific DNA-cytosine methylase
MNILLACEESQNVCLEYRKKGHNAFSCDILPCSGGYPEWHMQCDVREALTLTRSTDQHKGSYWDMIIAFPPCTHLANSGSRHFAKKIADGRQQKAFDFFMVFTSHMCPRIAIENPIGIMSTRYRKPDQIIYPWQFGHSCNKPTCLWLKGLPYLKPTLNVEKEKYVTFPSGKKMGKWYYETSCLPQRERATARAKTFKGIAEAMSQQWDKYLF